MDLSSEVHQKIGSRIVTRPELYQIGLTQRNIDSLLNEGVLRQPKRGYFRLSEAGISEVDLCEEAFLIVGEPSFISFWSALSIYGLIGDIPSKSWLTVSFEKRTQSKELRFFRSRNPYFDVGIDKKTFPFWISSVERTLIDCLSTPRIVDQTTALQALFQADKENLVDSDRLWEVAHALSVYDKVKGALRVFSERNGTP